MKKIRLSRKIPKTSGTYIVKVAYDEDGLYEDDGEDQTYLAEITVEGQSVYISPLSLQDVDHNDSFILDKDDATVSFFGPIEFLEV